MRLYLAVIIFDAIVANIGISLLWEAFHVLVARLFNDFVSPLKFPK